MFNGTIIEQIYSKYPMWLFSTLIKHITFILTHLKLYFSILDFTTTAFFNIEELGHETVKGHKVTLTWGIVLCSFYVR